MQPYDLRNFLNGGSSKPAEAQKSPAAENNPAPILGAETKVELPKIAAANKDEYIAKAMNEMVLASGWVATRTTPEANYYFYTYLPPASKRSWQQARIYISKLNLSRIITIEGLTIPAGVQDRINIVIRMQKTGGIDRLMNSKTITQILDTNNYFSQNSELINEEGLRAVLSSYLRQAEIL